MHARRTRREPQRVKLPRPHARRSPAAVRTQSAERPSGQPLSSCCSPYSQRQRHPATAIAVRRRHRSRTQTRKHCGAAAGDLGRPPHRGGRRGEPAACAHGVPAEPSRACSWPSRWEWQVCGGEQKPPGYGRPGGYFLICTSTPLMSVIISGPVSQQGGCHFFRFPPHGTRARPFSIPVAASADGLKAHRQVNG